jgi:hypothetical protein
VVNLVIGDVGLDKEPALVLCHVEVQNQYEVVFPNRMYSYNYRLRDRYNCSIVSLAILGDEMNPDGMNWKRAEIPLQLW